MAIEAYPCQAALCTRTLMSSPALLPGEHAGRSYPFDEPRRALRGDGRPCRARLPSRAVNVEKGFTPREDANIIASASVVPVKLRTLEPGSGHPGSTQINVECHDWPISRDASSNPYDAGEVTAVASTERFTAAFSCAVSPSGMVNERIA